MATKLSEVRQLCTKREIQLFKSVRPTSIPSYSPAALKKKIDRVRTAQEKYEQLSRPQRRKARAAASSDSDPHAQRKAEIFGELLERLEARSALLEARKNKPKKAASAKKTVKKAAPKKAAKKSVAAKKTTKKRTTKKAVKATASKASTIKSLEKPKKKAASPITAKKLAAPKTTKKRTITPKGQGKAVKKATKVQQRTQSKAVRGHIKAQGKRAQARRDARR
ncbi:MAG TPA: hypothetical protein PLJ27_10075 [Polyangiaceae bacterium]|nr:MAG: hypothetical protein BWY17_03451 [Deltaproteobacteria bacterium ADurb.Bin207]HNS98394.1 hypothetical protein [Polyangiaceae bacterium]HNZ25418.1 hypothetical protein [Polyangiaceae bacterium]HOD24987.1 hypothetical protein [Polyangiaceae bacterium]HOE51309.1 hypothetical protein [Polyangiaceae bacterium]